MNCYTTSRLFRYAILLNLLFLLPIVFVKFLHFLSLFIIRITRWINVRITKIYERRWKENRTSRYYKNKSSKKSTRGGCAYRRDFKMDLPEALVRNRIEASRGLRTFFFVGRNAVRVFAKRTNPCPFHGDEPILCYKCI